MKIKLKIEMDGIIKDEWGDQIDTAKILFQVGGYEVCIHTPNDWIDKPVWVSKSNLIAALRSIDQQGDSIQ